MPQAHRSLKKLMKFWHKKIYINFQCYKQFRGKYFSQMSTEPEVWIRP